jgi:6-phosphofructokinase 1
VQEKKRLGVLTSGGDSPGMNAAVRAVVRAALAKGAEVYAIYEGYQGMVEGGECPLPAPSSRDNEPFMGNVSLPQQACIRPIFWHEVSGILQKGGTIIGTARSLAFKTREGRRRAARNLIREGIDRLVAIGGDGTLTGADLFRREWSELLKELVENGEIRPEEAAAYPQLAIVGLTASIDNDMYGSDMTIGTDTALHRITEAVDAISSTAASHQRTFVVEVMGRNCGYLALMGAIATGADWVMIPEQPPQDNGSWEDRMCSVLKAGRDSGRRDTIVIVAEGSRDSDGNPISSDRIKQVLEERLGEDARVTILGHVQRGGSPSAFDRNLSTLLGCAAVDEILKDEPHPEPLLIGMHGNRIVRSPLMHCVQQTHVVAEAIANGEYERAMDLRGNSFKDACHTFQTLMQAAPHTPSSDRQSRRIAVLNCGAAAPGMNTAVRAAVRLGIDRGHTMLGIDRGFRGLIDGSIKELGWLSVRGWATTGGSELGTSRKLPEGRDFYQIARQLEAHDIHGLLMIGGWAGYEAIYQLYSQRDTFPAFNIPMLCVPASIDNNLPGAELSIGTDTALNNIIEAVDKIKQSAVASNRCFVVKVMGRYCGYLAVMSGLATGAERVYIHEEQITLTDLQKDITDLIEGFKHGKRVGLIVCNENAHPVYNTDFICSLFAEEGREVFQVRQAILGHLQQGGDPTPFDRIQATRLAEKGLDFLIDEAQKPNPAGAFMGVEGGQVKFIDLSLMPRMVDKTFRRPKDQWWFDIWPMSKMLAQPPKKIG